MSIIVARAARDSGVFQMCFSDVFSRGLRNVRDFTHPFLELFTKKIKKNDIEPVTTSLDINILIVTSNENTGPIFFYCFKSENVPTRVTPLLAKILAVDYESLIS